MYKSVILLSENAIKDNSIITNNLESKYIQQAVILAQEMCLQPLLGTTLLNEIYAQVQDDDIEDRIKTLLDDYIQPILLNAAISNIIVNVSMKIKNLGVVNTNDTNVNNFGLKDIQWYKAQYDYNADFFINRCRDYLVQNKEQFPEWPGCNCNGMRGGQTNYKIGIVI